MTHPEADEGLSPTVDDMNPALPYGLKGPKLWELWYIPRPLKGDPS